MTGNLLTGLLDREDLTPYSVRELVRRLVAIETSDVERAALLVSLRAKGETTLEVEGFAREMRRRALPFEGPRRSGAVDLCGCGGAPNPSFNVGTVSALVVRACGVPVAKHGNRSARGSRMGYAGSSDLLEALGLPYPTSREFATASFREEGITYLHAPLFHPATRAVMPVRRALGIPTIFNFLGPLTNPARVLFQVVGCPDGPSTERVARILPRLGVRRGMAVTSSDGADEFSPRTTSKVVLWENGGARRRTVDPRALLEAEDRRGSWGPLPAAEAAEETERILAGGGGAARGSILLTSAAALWAGGRVRSMGAGVAAAAGAIDRGDAANLLERLRELAGSRAWPPEE